MATRRLSGVSALPLTLDEVKQHLRVVANDEDDKIESLIVSALDSAETETGRAIMPQTWELALTGFPREIVLDKAPFLSLESVRYMASDGGWLTLDAAQYDLDDFACPVKIVPVSAWPVASSRPNSVRVRYRVGFADAASVPEPLKDWMKLQIGALFEFREGVLPGAKLAINPVFDGLLRGNREWPI